MAETALVAIQSFPLDNMMVQIHPPQLTFKLVQGIDTPTQLRGCQMDDKPSTRDTW